MPKDIWLDNDYDLMTKNGDFVTGESTPQHKALLYRAEPGEFRQYPEATIGIQKYLEDDATGDLATEVKEKFEADGMIVKKVKVYEGGIIDEESDYGDR